MTAIRIDSVAQQVEHNTFNVGVLGSSPSWITKNRSYLKHKHETASVFLYSLVSVVTTIFIKFA